MKITKDSFRAIINYRKEEGYNHPEGQLNVNRIKPIQMIL